MKNFFTLLFVFFLHTAWATTYYFSAVSGDDSRTSLQARNPATPWKSLNKLNASFSIFQPGDSILLKRDDIFYGSITIAKSGTASLPIVIGAYGTGNKPVVTSLVTLDNWVSVGNGIWESYNPSFGTSVGTVLLNDQAQELGRYPNADAPNKGYLTFESHVGTTSITDNQLTSNPDWTGAEVVIRTRRWVTDRNLITSHLGSTINYTASSTYSPSDNFGYFIQNDIKTLDKLGEWYFNAATKKLSVYFGSNNPSSYTVQATTIDNLINTYKYNNIVFDNLAIKGANASGVYAKYGTNLLVSNCDILFSAVNGVSAYYITNMRIENCSITNSNNDGIDLGYAGDYASIKNNKITNSSIYAGMSGSGDGKGMAIHCNGNSALIANNEIVNTGYTAINFGGDSTVVRNNYIDNFCMTKDDGGAIYTYTGSSNATRYGRKVIGNIVLNGKGAPEGTYPVAASAEGIYCDDNSSGIEISNNTVANLAGRGLFLNNARELTIRNNTFYNNDKQLYANQYRKIEGAAIRNLVVKGNILFSKDNNEKVAHFTTEQNDNNLIGILDSNYYTRPIDDRLVILNSYVDSSGARVNENLDLEGWQKKYSKDSASKRSARQITPYKLNSVIGVNKFTNGTFTSSMKGVFTSSCSAALRTAGQLDGSYLEVTPSAKNSSIFVNIGGLKAGSKYVLRYTVKSSSSNDTYITLSLRKQNSPYTILTPLQNRKINSTTTNNEMVFVSPVTDTATQIVFKVDSLPKYYLDNIQFYEADASTTNLDDSIQFVYNATTLAKAVKLNGNFVNVKNEKFANSILLQPYQSAVLIKDNLVQNVAPTISLTAPVANTNFAAPASLTINATASDTDGRVTKVEFYNGNTLLGTDTISPYTFTWNNVSAGKYSITAKATDDQASVTTSAAVSVSVYTPNVPPSVSLTSPVANSTLAAPASITITAAATDLDGKITKVNFYNNDTLVGTSTVSPYTLTLNNLTAGTYSITAKAIDDSSAITTSTAATVSVYTPNVAPYIDWTSSVKSTTLAAPASLTISANASDADGSITKVDFYNNDTIIGTATASPYTLTLKNVTAGTYFITAKATDDSSAVTASAPIAISVYTPNVAPAVTLVNPTANATIAAPASVTISANAVDGDGKITKVDFYNNDTLIGTATASPYTIAWNNVGAGNYSITAKATDDSSAVTTSSSVSISVYTPNIAPSVSLTSPVTTTKYVGPATINITASANDIDGTISSVMFYNGSTYLKTVSASPYTYSMTNVAPGSYTITAKATDNKGLVTTSAPVTVTVQQNIAPSVTLTSPVATTKYVGPTTIKMSATASDSDGTIASVKFYNGTTYLKTVFTSPYTYSMTNAAAGTYTITAKATDDKGAMTVSSPVTIVVAANIPPSVSLTSPAINATYTAASSISLSAQASDLDGSISKVEFYNGSTLITSKTAAPYTYTWPTVAAGSYTITAKATDNKGAVTTSQSVTITVKAPLASRSVDNSHALNLSNRDTLLQETFTTDVRLFPNPAVSKLQIKFEGMQINNQKAMLSITNLSGIVIKRLPVVLSGRSIEADVNSLTAGIYLLHIVTDDFVVTKKFIKN